MAAFCRVICPILEGPIEGETFETYFTRICVPELRPGGIIKDNLSSHERVLVQERAETVGATFLPGF